jgi:hypothetical protein
MREHAPRMKTNLRMSKAAPERERSINVRSAQARFEIS